jgi:putative nucleotidyltransferase with HDIG domain
MRDPLRSYTIISLICFACAVVSTVYIWHNFPPVGDLWPAVIWFVLFTFLAATLGVGVSKGNRTVTPTFPAHWATTCIWGPLVGVVVCLSASLLAFLVTCIAFYLARSLGLLDAQGTLTAPKPRVHNRSCKDFSVVGWATNLIARIGSNLYMRDLDSVVRVIILNSSILTLSVGLSGVVYSLLGGRFLIAPGSDFNLWTQFILPFYGLVLTSIAIEYGIYAILIANMDPLPGTRRVFAFLLRCKMSIIEDVIPVLKGEFFLSIVALMFSYLYMHIGAWGFMLAVMPVLTLRDFFNQWVEEKTAYMDTITTLATYMQHYHPYTRGHLKRVADLSERLARELRLPAEIILHMRTAGFIHDIGKIGVSEEILDKTEKLTDEEWAKIKEHPVKGAEIISHLEFLENIVDWVKYHHKWYNGAGYPANSVDGSKIPIEAAIIAVADAFDAMTDDRELTLDWKCDSCGFEPPENERPIKCPVCGAEKRRIYREPKTIDEAVDELRRGAGSQFHPAVVKAFLTMLARDGVKLNAQ